MVCFIRYLLLAAVIALSACTDVSSEQSKSYYTWDGLEPDRWASVWLMNRHVSPGAKIDIVPVGAGVKDAESIVTPASKIKRTHGKSTYENLVSAYRQSGDPVLMKIGGIINEIEISPWQRSTPLAAVVEKQFRQLQYDYNRVNVPMECYSGFFDAMYEQLANTNTLDQVSLEAALSPAAVCTKHRGVIATIPEKRVFEYSTDHVLNMIAAERSIVFVDTREEAEFDERHIPGAVNLKLREVSPDNVESIKDADLVIAYCIKDFRGYEVALAMSKAGVRNVGIMNPFGLKGWTDQGLPVVNSDTTEEQALDQLRSKALLGV